VSCLKDLCSDLRCRLNHLACCCCCHPCPPLVTGFPHPTGSREHCETSTRGSRFKRCPSRTVPDELLRRPTATANRYYRTIIAPVYTAATVPSVTAATAILYRCCDVRAHKHRLSRSAVDVLPSPPPRVPLQGAGLIQTTATFNCTPLIGVLVRANVVRLSDVHGSHETDRKIKTERFRRNDKYLHANVPTTVTTITVHHRDEPNAAVHVDGRHRVCTINVRRRASYQCYCTAETPQ
jgi:hypothetical protein